MRLDTYRSVETPEGVELGLRVVGPVPRFLAWAIDSVIRAAAYTAVSPLLLMFGGTGVGAFLVLLFLGEWFYFVFFEVLRRGATPGKSALGIHVVHDDGTPVSWTSSLLRNLVRAADYMPMAWTGAPLGTYGFGLASVFWSRDFKRLGDRVAGTVVCYDEAPYQHTKPATVETFSPPFPLSSEEQRVLLDFAERSRSWTRARSIELSDLLEPLTGARGEVGLERALGMAAWFQGER